MLNKNVETALNEQVKNELYSAYLYLSMVAYLESANLPGFAKWMRVQAKEEVSHGMKMFDYVCERGGRAVLQGIVQPPVDFKGPLDIMEKAYAHERTVTGMINKLYETAAKEGDYATQTFLQWFLNEQVEEEKNASDLVAMLKMTESKEGGILYIDQHAGKREG